jgi:hypothetical protein
MHGSRSGWRVSTATMGGIPPSVARVRVQRTFSFATHMRQVFAIASMPFGAIAKSATGVVLWAAIAGLIVLVMPALMELRGVPLVPRTADVIALLTAPMADNPRAPWVLVPLLIVFYAGELVWQDRDARLSEIADATPVPEWVFLLGKLLGLGLVLVMWMALLATAGMLGQARMGYFDFELGLYLRILFGIQFIEYLLFAVLVFAVHSVVNQKHVGYLVALSRRSRCLRRRQRHFLHESELVAGNRVSTESRAECSGSAKTVWTRPTAPLPIARRRQGAPDSSRRRSGHLRSDRGYEHGSGRRCAGDAPPHVDGRGATLLPLRHGCIHQQSVWCVLRRLYDARRTVDPFGGRGAGRRDSNLPSPWAYRAPAPYGGKRTSLARSLLRDARRRGDSRPRAAARIRELHAAGIRLHGIAYPRRSATASRHRLVRLLP